MKYHLSMMSTAVIALMLASAALGDAVITVSYAPLVKRVAPSVVTVMVEEKRVGAGQRAAELASAGKRQRCRYHHPPPAVRHTEHPG